MPASIVALLAFGVPTAFAAPPATAPSSPPAEVDIDSLPVKAPDVGTITQRTTTGARTTSSKFGLYLFSPGTAGATVKEHPTFYWYLAQPNDEDTEFVVTEQLRQAGGKLSEKAILMRKIYTGNQPPGIYACTLDQAALEPNKLYQVSVVVHRSADPSLGEVVNSIGYLTRVADTGVDADDPAACAKAGLWYDAIDAAMRRIAKEPKEQNTAVGHRQLHALLRGEHVFTTVVPAGPADSTTVRASAQQEKELFDGLDALHDALIMTKPPEKSRHGR